MAKSCKPSFLTLPFAMFSVATFFYLYEFFLRVSPNVLERDLMNAFALDAKAFGLFSSCYYWSYAPLQLPVGALTDKYGPRRLLTFAILLCSLSTLLLAVTQSFFIACLSRFFIGAGSAFAFITCLKIAYVWFESRLFSRLTSATLMIGTLGAAVGGTPLSLALEWLTWRELMFYIGLVGLILAIVAWMSIRDHNPLHAEAEIREQNMPGFWGCLKEVMRQGQSWIVGIYAFFVTAPTDAFGGTWGITFLVDVHGLSRNAASVAAVTMTFTGMAVGSILLGSLSDKYDNRKGPMFFAAVLSAICLSLIVYLPKLDSTLACILFFLFGATGTYVLAFVMVKRFTRSLYVATAVGFVNMVSMFGSAGLTYLIGWLLHAGQDGLNVSQIFYTASDYRFSLVVLPLFYIITAILVVPFIRDAKSPACILK